eukprot:201491_1
MATATAQDLAALQRKIAVNSYHQTTQRPHGLSRPRSYSGDVPKPVQTKRSLKTNKSRSKDTNHVHLPKPFKSVKQMFKKSKHDKNTSDPHIHSRSFSGNPHKKLKSRSRHKNHSVSNIAKPLNLKKIIDTQLLQQYQQYVENRVEMLRSRAFPNDVLYELPQYRADLTNSLAQSRPKSQYSRHTECAELNRAELRKAEQNAHQHATKLSNKTSTFKSIRKAIVRPTKPITKLFHQPKPIKAKTPEAHFVPLNDHSNATTLTIPPEDSMSVIMDDDDDDAAITQEEQKHSHPEITPCPNGKEETPVLPPLLMCCRTMDTPQLPQRYEDKEELKRAATCHEIEKHRRCSSDPSPTPPFLTTRTPNVRGQRMFDHNLDSNTPSWVNRESTSSNYEEMENDGGKHVQAQSNTTVLIHGDYEILQSKYDALETQCDEMQMTMRSMQQAMEEQKNRIDGLTQEMQEMKDNVKVKPLEKTQQTVAVPLVKDEALAEKKQKNKTRLSMQYFDKNYGKFWDKFKSKVLRESERISFERSKWENLYHSLLMYFMNGCRVIFNLFAQAWLLVVFLLGYFVCCERNNEDHGDGNKPDEYMMRFSDVNVYDSLSQRSNSRSLKRRRKKKRRLRRNNDIWREQHQNESASSEC